MHLNFFSAVVITTLLQSQHAFSHRHGHKHLVDLGYAKHVPTYTNTTTANATLLNYNNIRYAEPPTGSKRFRKPVTPPPHQRGIQNGNRSSWETDCIASAPEGVPFPALSGKSWGSEDCLFLNVVVPEGVKPGDKVPVLHWVVGSAYAFGSKDWQVFGIDTLGLFNMPLGLSDRFIVVTHNYRLGMTGWLPKLDRDMNGNVGVWDSLAALEWTKKHIHKFGGDPDNITAIGQSAGAAIITWLLLAQEGNMKLPFDQAFISSPGIAPRRNLERSRPVFNAVLNATGCDSVACMRRLPESKIKEANKALLDMATNGGGGALGPGVGFTPLVDGELVSYLPLTGFELGKFNKGVKRVISGNTADEGLGTSSERDMPGRFPVIVRGNIPNVSNESIAKLQAMYSYPPEVPEKLARDYTTDIIFGCAAANIAQAYGDKARRYLFSIPPVYHGAEMNYFFFAKNETTPVSSLKTAEAAQSYLLQFMFRKDLDTNASYAGPLSAWPSFTARETVANITNAGFEFGKQDEVVAKRCAYINELLRDPKNGV